MDRRILEAMRLMERRMGEDLPVEELAAAFGLSLHHFHRLFVEETGEPPASFLRRIRMDAAALRLKWADEPTGTIAHAIGFRSRPAFIRAFERQFGVPPARYRKDYRASADVTATIDGHAVSLREVGGFHLLARRYVGDIFRMREYWEDFLARLPAGIAAPARGSMSGCSMTTSGSPIRRRCAMTAPSPSTRRMRTATGRSPRTVCT